MLLNFFCSNYHYITVSPTDEDAKKRMIIELFENWQTDLASTFIICKIHHILLLHIRSINYQAKVPIYVNLPTRISLCFVPIRVSWHQILLKLVEVFIDFSNRVILINLLVDSYSNY
jgi:hypothetical protein